MQTKKLIPRCLIVFTTFFFSACTVHSNWEFDTKPIHAENRETAELADVTADVLELAERAGPENVLVVLDMDNTILAMEQGLGADQWYEWQKDLAVDDRCNPHNVGNRFAVQGALFFASAMRPTQADATRQVKTIQDHGIPVIVVTSRGQEYRLQTFRELRRNGFNFSHSAIGPAGGYRQAFMPLEKGRLSRYEDGVFLTAGQHKGRMLYALLQKTDTRLPAVIVVADDKQKNLDAVIETFSALGIPVHAWRYSAEDENVARFNPEQAHTQWQSIEPGLQKLQQVLGPDNYDLSTAVRPAECQ